MRKYLPLAILLFLLALGACKKDTPPITQPPPPVIHHDAVDTVIGTYVGTTRAFDPYSNSDTAIYLDTVLIKKVDSISFSINTQYGSYFFLEPRIKYLGDTCHSIATAIYFSTAKDSLRINGEFLDYNHGTTIHDYTKRFDGKKID